MTSDAALKVARELTFSLGVPLHVVKLIPFDDYRVVPPGNVADALCPAVGFAVPACSRRVFVATRL